jgi:hypothetical protein
VSPNGDNDNATEQFKLGLVMDCSWKTSAQL